MILSYHPCFVGDQNQLCAGREPDIADVKAIQAADGVILPQGCSQALYETVRRHCDHVFPNFDARFNFPGKIGQNRLFRRMGVPHPQTVTFPSLEAFHRDYGASAPLPVGFPLVFKFDWGGEGETVHLIESAAALRGILETAAQFERTGQYGFLIQEYILCRQRALRVNIIGRQLFSYWRIQENPDRFRANLTAGATIDTTSDPKLQQSAVESVRDFASNTGINLAGFDIVFLAAADLKTPLFLEINYFFGRNGLGGSEKFYKILNQEIQDWIERRGLVGDYGER